LYELVKFACVITGTCSG